MLTAPKQDIINDLQRLSLAHENVTRRIYREHGKFSDTAIENTFGGFLEAKRAAGLQHTRLQSQVVSAVARHAAHDQVRQFNIDRADYGDNYRKPTGRRFQTVLATSDLHDIECDAFLDRKSTRLNSSH